MSYVEGMYIRHKRSGAVGTISKVDEKFGTVIVDYIIPVKRRKIYSDNNDRLPEALHVMHPYEIADFRLAQEKHGLTDSWME